MSGLLWAGGIEVAGAQTSSLPAGGIRFGLAHIDVMEHHALRQDDGPARIVERIEARELSERYRLAVDSGVAYHRFSIYRDLVERDDDRGWAIVDAMLERDVARGIASLAVLQSPASGIDQPAFLDAAGVPTEDPGLAERINPANGWARFVDAAARRYAPGGRLAQRKAWQPGMGVRAWEIGNEPNLRHFWTGSAADYARFLRQAHAVIKRHDPEALVLHAGIADDGNAEAWFGRFLDALEVKPGTALPFDRSAWHWYREPRSLMTGPRRVEALFAARGLRMPPLWVTETGISIWSEHPGPCWDAGSPGRVTLAEQSGFVWQTLSEAAASHIETLVYFQLRDDCGNGPASYDAFGLVRNPQERSCWAPPPGDPGCWKPGPGQAGTPRPAFEAFKVAVAELTGASPMREPAMASPGLRLLRFQRQPKGRISVAWNLGSAQRELRIPAASSEARLIQLDATGKPSESRIEPLAGEYRLPLSGATNRNLLAGRSVTSGLPTILVEPEVIPRPASLEPAAALAMDESAPELLLLEALPPRMPRTFDLSLVAGDAESGLAAWVVYVAEGVGPPKAEDWQPLAGLGLWTGDPRADRMRVRFEGRPGRHYRFAAQVGDRAGNWTEKPLRAQASTRIIVDKALRRATLGRIPR